MSFSESCQTVKQVLSVYQVQVIIKLGVGLHFYIHPSEYLIDVEGEVELITKHLTKSMTNYTDTTIKTKKKKSLPFTLTTNHKICMSITIAQTITETKVNH